MLGCKPVACRQRWRCSCIPARGKNNLPCGETPPEAATESQSDAFLFSFLTLNLFHPSLSPPPPSPPRSPAPCPNELLLSCQPVRLSPSVVSQPTRRPEPHSQTDERQSRGGGAERRKRRKRMWLINRMWCRVWKATCSPAPLRLVGSAMNESGRELRGRSHVGCRGRFSLRLPPPAGLGVDLLVKVKNVPSDRDELFGENHSCNC